MPADSTGACTRPPCHMSNSVTSGRIPIMVISPNEAYRSALVALLAAQEFVLASAGHRTPAEAAEDSPGLVPPIVVVDGGDVGNVLESRRTWPNAVVICSLDYIDEWDFIKSLGADVCVLKDRGVSAILEAIAQIGDSSAPSVRQT